MVILLKYNLYILNMTKEEKREYNRKYYQDNKSILKEKAKEYYTNNKDNCVKKQKQYYDDNKEDIKAYQQKYNQKNKEDIKAYKQKWYQKNKDALNERSKEQYKHSKTTKEGRATHLLCGYRLSERRNNRGECTINKEWIVENIFNSTCIYCGETDWTKLGCDRIDDKLPHTPENCVCACKECNVDRYYKRMTVSEYIDYKKLSANT